MKKQDLKTGMIVKLRNNEAAVIVLDPCIGEDCIILAANHAITLSSYRDNLLYNFDTTSPSFRDIIEVYMPMNISRCIDFSKIAFNHFNFKLIWERPIEETKVPEYTIEQLIKKVGHEFKIIK